MSMLERVAKAIHDELENDDDSDGGGYMRAARVALAVMQKPTNGMIQSGKKVMRGYGSNGMSLDRAFEEAFKRAIGRGLHPEGE